MKHLKKYNESIDKSISDYINECFLEFFDDSKYETEVDGGYEDRHCLMINLPILSNTEFLRQSYSIDDFIKWSNEINDFYLDIKTCINRIKDKYPNMDVRIEEDSFQRRNIPNNKVETIDYIIIYFIVE